MKYFYALSIALLFVFKSQSQNLLAHYPFNGDAMNEFGISNGIISGASITSDRNGIPYSAYNFDGNDYINLGNSTNIKPTSAISVSCWFELNSAGVANARKFISCTENGGYSLAYLSNDSIQCILRRNSLYGTITIPATAYDNTGWHFATMTYDGRYLKLYMDGVLQGTDDAGANYPISYNNFTNTLIGAEPTGGGAVLNGYYYQGKLDEVKIYDYALPDTMIANEFAAGNQSISKVGLKLWLRSDTGINLNGNHVTQWDDISGNNQSAYQPNAINQPEIINNAANGKPVLRFDGTDDILFSPNLDLTATNKATVFVVNKSTGGICIEHSRNLNTSSNGFYIADNFNLSGITAALKGNTLGPLSNYQSLFKSSIINTNLKIINTTFDKSQTSYIDQILLRQDGLNLENTNGYGGTHTNNFSNDTIFIGGRSTGGVYMNGDIAEVIIYDRTLSNAEKSQVENYLNQRYNSFTSLVQNSPGSGNALFFDGINDYVEINNPSLNEYSIETWVNFTGSVSNRNILVMTNAAGANSSYSHQIRTNASGAFVHYTYDGAGNNVTGTTNAIQNKWYHVCITAKNGSVAKLYVNGIEQGTPNPVGSLWNSGTKFIINGTSGGSASRMSGYVDEVRVWDTVFSQNQIRDRMCRKIDSTDSLFSHLVFDLNFDENSGIIAHDLSVNERNGILTNGPLHVISGASIGDRSIHDYSGPTSSVNINDNSLGDFTAQLTAGSASGLQVYNVFTYPNTLSGIDSISPNSGYFGVFVPNGTANEYEATYHYLNNAGFMDENYISLYKRTNNSDTVWTNAQALLDTDSNTLKVTGQNTEYIIGANIIFSTYYRDLDGDGYGNPIDSLGGFSQPVGYVNNNTDCNDLDSLEYPGQAWYLDDDHDLYGTGTSLIQCERPLNRFAGSELILTSGDCNDNDSLIYPNSQHFELVGSGNFTNAVIHPTNGDSYTTFNFEVIYKNANGDFPISTFPRVLLDYDGNGVYNNNNDRTIIMYEDDITDTNTVDGKKYIASINGLPTGTNWKTLIQTNPVPCGSNLGTFDYPDVYVRPDLEIFANDITFSEPNPPISSPFVINATIHNVSDFPAQNFIVHLIDQYDTTIVFPDIIVSSLSPHSNTQVSWNFTTISTPTWHPMQVIVDYTNVIDESNELDNSAIRPYINGNYNLPGNIVVTAVASPLVSYLGNNGVINLSGSAHYSGTAVPLIDSSVAGATISFTIIETGANFTAYTNSNGHYSYSFPKPILPGVYHIEGTCTDFTLTGNFSAQFELLEPVITTCQLPNLISTIAVSSINVVQGDSITGSITVKNSGLTSAPASSLSFAQGSGVPILDSIYTIPSLAPNANFTIPFTLTFNTLGQFSICALADADYLITECSESNSSCKVINVLPPLPDIVPVDGPYGVKYQCSVNNISFKLANYGGVATGSFNCHINIKQNGNIIGSSNHVVSNINPIQFSPANTIQFSIPFSPPATGEYTFEIFADSPNNDILELNESNNNATYSITVIPCKPDFAFSGCESFNVESDDGNYSQGNDIKLHTTLVNSGNQNYIDSITVRFSLSNGSIYDTTLFVNLNAGNSMVVSKIIPAPLSASANLTAIVDPLNLIDELNDANNTISNKMCWDFHPIDYCVPIFTGSLQPNQPVSLSVAVASYYLYDADTLKVKFKVSGPGLSGTIDLGNGLMYNVKQTCLCPLGASLPINFVFPQAGTYTFTMTVDPDNDFLECDESNNVLVKNVVVSDLPDMRILSQFIAPSKLNPDPNESVSMNVTYENIGESNINSNMKLKVLVDNQPIDSIYPVSGLVHNGNATIPIPASWSSSLVGVHVIRAIIDDDNQIIESNELNNEATRAIIVGESANLYFQAFGTNNSNPTLGSTININTRIGNSGDLNCQAELQLFYVDDFLDTILINSQAFQVDAHDSIPINFNWIVLDNKTTIWGKIVNTSILEYTYDDNTSFFKLGEMKVILSTTPACNNNNSTGSALAYILGGVPPYNYFWNNGYNGELLEAAPGSYSVTVSDNTGQSAIASINIDTCPDIRLTLKFYMQGYYIGTETMTSVLLNQGRFNMPSDVDTVFVELRKDSIGFPLVASFKGILKTNGQISCYYYTPEVLGTNCFIVIKSRNGIETWSSNSILITELCNFDFSLTASSSFGNNQTEVESNVYALYSGDVNQDGTIDIFDFLIWDLENQNFSVGYFDSDINGDGSVDIFDFLIWDPNNQDFIGVIAP